jgi:hypothetical protein
VSIAALLPLVRRRAALAAGCTLIVAGATIAGGSIASAHPRPAPHHVIRHPPALSGSVQALAQAMVPPNQFASFSAVISHESGWNVHARNRSSGAYGLGQALPAGKMAAAGADWQDNPATQIRWTLGYMNGRYGSPNGAWAFWRTHHWY